jgi:hypothetical protein
MADRDTLAEKILSRGPEALTDRQIETVELLVLGMQWSPELDDIIQGLASGFKLHLHKRSLDAYLSEEEA